MYSNTLMVCCYLQSYADALFFLHAINIECSITILYFTRRVVKRDVAFVLKAILLNAFTLRDFGKHCHKSLSYLSNSKC